MAFTYQSAVDLARRPLNDEDKTRYLDETLMAYANTGVLELVKRRPDLWVGQYQSLPTGANVLTDTFPLPAPYVQTLANCIVLLAEMTDDEHVNSGRAAIFGQLFGGEAPA